MQLDRNWSDFLVNRPETGMGYQIADFTLQDGSVHTGCFVFNCEDVKMSDRRTDPSFTCEDIRDIHVH